MPTIAEEVAWFNRAPPLQIDELAVDQRKVAAPRRRFVVVALDLLSLRGGKLEVRWAESLHEGVDLVGELLVDSIPAPAVQDVRLAAVTSLVVKAFEVGPAGYCVAIAVLAYKP